MKKLFILVLLLGCVACTKKPEPVPLVKSNGNLVTCPKCNTLIEVVKEPQPDKPKPSLLDRLLG
jgi:uncharacterized Zn finger protein (UPF0148 family)